MNGNGFTVQSPNKKINVEIDYEKCIKQLLEQKYLALSSMNDIDKEYDSLMDKKEKKETSKKKKSFKNKNNRLGIYY